MLSEVEAGAGMATASVSPASNEGGSGLDTGSGSGAMGGGVKPKIGGGGMKCGRKTGG